MENKNEKHKVDIVIDTSKLGSAMPSDHFTSQVAQIAEMARKATQVQVPVINAGIQGFLRQNTKLIDSIVSAQKNAIESINKIAQSGVFDAIKQTAELATRMAKRLQSHFPENWPSDEIEKCANLSMQGLPIILVPRPSIVSKIVNAKNIQGIKQVVIRNDVSVIEDCEAAIAESTWLSKDMRLQIMESIACYKDGKYRAAQSTANVAFDSLLNEIIDIRAWRRTNGNSRKLSASKVKQLTEEFTDNLMDLPLSRAPFYTLLMFPVIGSALADFEIGNATTYVSHYNRHMSAHTVSSKQYKRSNALLAIMGVASICKVTHLRGKNWMQISAKEYGVDMTAT